MVKGRPTPKRGARRPAALLGSPADRELLLKLVVEMHHIHQDLLAALGVTPPEDREAARRARRTRTRSRPSAALMAAVSGAGDVLSTWRRDRRYLGTDGSPRVLAIRGRGATLETLARQCVPQMPLEELLDFICSHGEAARYKGDRIALLGSAAVLTRRTPEMTLAWLLTQVRHVADTILHNAAIPPERIKGAGLFQRQVAGWLSEKDFRRYVKAVGPQLQALCTHLEAGLSLDRRAAPRARRKECGVGVFLYQDSGSIG